MKAHMYIVGFLCSKRKKKEKDKKREKRMNK